MATVLLVIGILVFLIVVHELGHFIAAKFFKVRVEEFGIGYPPRAFTFGRWGGTEYTLNWLPFGGFVRLFGDVGENRHGEGSFIDKKKSVQAIVLVAGVFMNAVAAWFLFSAAFYIGVPRPVETVAEGIPSWLLVAEVVPGSPASLAGITAGDRIVEIEDVQGASVQTLAPDAVADFISTRAGKEIVFSYIRGADATTTTVVRPAHAVIPGDADKPAIGISMVLVATQSMSLFDAAQSGFLSTVGALKSVVAGLRDMVANAFRGDPVFKDIIGPVGLVGVVGDAAENGVGNVFALAAFISVNLVIINLLPIPALDGGRLFLLGIEAVLRRDASQFALRLLNAIGIAFIILLMVTVTYNDIARLLA